MFTWIVWPTLVKLSGQSHAATALAAGTSQASRSGKALRVILDRNEWGIFPGMRVSWCVR
ncbi:hypothetical protein [Pseudoxanthomonas sp. 10H]|uniref:hypothetical protein n=1 Tax=Pseudoxanthomonas sp. 10H TaxID=3242729 RepID=UPI003557364A